jgi:cytoskeletal protein CcmA (bactofilin family)
MSVFRNNPRPTENVEVPGRFGEAQPRVDTSNDLLGRAQPEDDRTAAYQPFAEREARPMPTESDKCPNVIAAGSRWSGSLNIEDSVRIEGQVSGEIIAKGTVHIADGARVDAKVRAAFVIVNGAFKGEVRCTERLELMPKSRVEGEIVTKVLNVHEGAIVDGSIQMQLDKEPPAARGRENNNRNSNNNNNAAATEPATLGS